MGLFDLQCPVCGGPLKVRGLRGLCVRCETRETLPNIQKKPHQPRPKPPKIRMQRPEDSRDKPEANREVARLQDNSRLSLNSQQEWRSKEDGNSVITSFTSFGQEYVTIQSRESVGLEHVPDGSTFDKYTNPTGPPENPPVIPPPPGPGPPPPGPIPPPNPPPRRRYPIIPPPGTPENPEGPVEPGTCPSCDVTITYTTTGMGAGETQDLGIDGYDPLCNYQWSVSSGGGSVSSGTGETTVYTAPSTNVDCNAGGGGTPTITLLCEGEPVDTLSIAVNIVSGQAGRRVYCANSYNLGTASAQILSEGINCDGTGTGSYAGCSPGSNEDIYIPPSTMADVYAAWAAMCAIEWGRYIVTPYCPGGPTGPDDIDTRTGAQITSGCCPPQFI